MNKINEKKVSDFEVKLNRVNRKLKKFLKIEQLEMDRLNIEDLEKFMVEYFATINRSAFYDSVRCLNAILEHNNINIVIDSKDYVDKCVKVPDEKYLTYTEVQRLCDSLINYQDKLMIYGLFKGIYGKAYNDLLTISTDNVADDYSYIDLASGKRFMCDDYMKRILRGSFKAKTYFKYIKADSDKMRADDCYELADSKYAIKPMPTAKNNDGKNPMAAASLQRNFMKFEKAFRDATGEDISITGESLITSGILYDMFQKEVEGKEWTVEEVDNYLKMNGLKKNKNEIYRKYYNRYYGTNRGE